MVRTEQTRAPPRDIARVKHFIDHAGAQATRARIAPPGRNGDISSDDFSKNPVFAVQVYTLVDLHLDEPSTKQMRLDTPDGSQPTELIALVDTLAPINTERPAPVFDIYPDPQPDVFACVAHQKREIAYRKAQADKPETLLIPKFAQSWGSGSNRKTGFCIILTGDMRGQFQVRGQRDPDDSTPILWARFRRGRKPFGEVMGNAYDVSFTRIIDYHAQQGMRSSEFEMLYSTSFSREDIDCDLEFDPDEVVLPLDKYCDVGPEDHDDEEAATGRAASINVDELTQNLALDTLTIQFPVANTVTISTHAPSTDPDLRYTIYVPSITTSSLEQTAKAFTASLIPHLTPTKTLFLTFLTPPDPSYGAILSHHHSHPSHPIGALLDLPEDMEHYALKGRLHCQSQCLSRRANDFNENDMDDYDGPTRYKTFIVILRGADSAVEYMLADGIPGAYVKRNRDMFDECVVWREEGGIEGLAKRLEMRLKEP